ncbi:chromate transporter [Puia dinghuensis]|uniref:Chromate resistance transporter n=1 Tax=Puia dinghuensis TaxID=1792502 RepID=A0A8J2UI33_9BACT|nr:chromate transporter [Puia dinghuensis]GGB21153.1 chromate resistance transporter [Puia dinghuensis]
MPAPPVYSLRQLGAYFLRLGTTGFGGPVALVGYMHRDLVEQRHWISEDEYREGLALAQLAPGPLAAQLAIYLGFVHYRYKGAALAGLAFVLPSFIMVVLLGMGYKLFGGMPWIRWVFYGVGATVIGVIAVSAYKLTTKTVGRLQWGEMRKRWLLWLVWLGGILATVITGAEPLWWLLGAGLLYMVVKAPPRWIRRKSRMAGIWLIATGFFTFDGGTLQRMGWFFLKAGAFVFGSGLAIVPFLHGGVVSGYHWLTEAQFLDAVAVAMITPGPVVITVGFIGYLVAGFPGAVVAALATFLPCYLFTVIPAPHFKQWAGNTSVRAFVDGITAAVMGALAGAVVLMGLRTVVDWPTGLLALGSCLVLWYGKKVKEPHVILLGAIVGWLLKFFIHT